MMYAKWVAVLPVFLLVAATQSGFAQSLSPTPVYGETRMVTFDYDDDRFYKVLVRPKNRTQLKFGAEERVTYVSAGDKSNFIVTVPTSKQFVEVQPKWENVSTNMLVVTTKRSYNLELQSTAEGKKWYARVTWTYDDAAGIDVTAAGGDGAGTLGKNRGITRDVLNSVDVEKINFKYEIAGDALFRPTQVFDDGTRTYVRLPERLQELPAMVMETPDTHEKQLVDYVVSTPYLIVPRIMDRFVLVLGKAEVSVLKTEAKGRSSSRWWQNSNPSFAERRGDN